MRKDIFQYPGRRRRKRKVIRILSIPRIVVAGTHSGCGKTTVARGIMEALVRRGFEVQPFKIGPDFIDPTHHTAICGRISRNLDPFMMGEDGVLGTFTRTCRGADIAIIEGVMGMYDGLEGSDIASTAHVMRILSSPALLVVDVNGMSRSAHALVKGYSEYEPGIRISGAVFNRVGSPRHREMIHSGSILPALGYIPRAPSLGIESRHLGLQMAHEIEQAGGLGEMMEEHCEIDRIIEIARSAPPLPEPDTGQESHPPCARIGIARDAAFCFYYQDNLDLLRRSGAELIPFSPMADDLPSVDAVYLGGGYPELHARALEESPCRGHIAKKAGDGMPVYGECGGLLYLCEHVTGERTHRMAGILPAEACMTGKIQALGYSDGSWTGGPGFVPAGSRILGHEFHYSEIVCRHDAHFAIRLCRGKGIIDGNDGMFAGESLATYTHAYFSKKFASSFVEAARSYQRS